MGEYQSVMSKVNASSPMKHTAIVGSSRWHVHIVTLWIPLFLALSTYKTLADPGGHMVLTPLKSVGAPKLGRGDHAVRQDYLFFTNFVTPERQNLSIH